MKQIDRNSQYYVFDVDGFFRDYKKNKRKLRDLEWDLAQAMSQGGMDYAKPKVDGGLPSSQVETAVERMSAIRGQIDDLRDFFALADKYLSALTNKERSIAEIYFVQGRKGMWAIEELCGKHYMSKASMYRTISEIRRKIRKMVETGQ